MKLAALFFAASLAITLSASAADRQDALDFQTLSIDGKPVDLEQYRGKVVLVVNVASQCGLTPQYAGLQAMYEKYKDQGLVILGFPSNQFGQQEPGSNKEIAQFCSEKYDVSFPMFAKIDVNGDDAAPLYQYLTRQDAKPAGAGKISWTFEKFLVDRQGNVAGRFAPRTRPDDEQLVAAVEAELAEKTQAADRK